MKKILMVVILGLTLLPVTAMAQKWEEPYTQKNGSQVEGHWNTPQDNWQKDFSKPGNINPLTGQLNTYGRRKLPPSSPEPVRNTLSSYDIPGSKPGSAADPYAIPGSKPDSASNPYATPRSKPDSAANPYAVPGSNPYSSIGSKDKLR